MADRYWVGGTATWDGTAGTKWSTTSGGAGGASVPTFLDNVFFDQAGAYTVTFGTGYTANCANFTSTSTAVTFSGSPAVFTVNGSFSVDGATIWSSNVAVTFSGLVNPTNTVTTNGVSIGNNGGVILNDTGVSGSITLGSALTLVGPVTITSGTFNTNNYNVTATSLSSSNSNTRTINLGSSTVTLSAGTPVAFQTSANLTFNAGTSTIVWTGIGGTFAGGGQTFYNLSSTSTSGTNSIFFSGSNTFNNIDITGPASAGVKGVVFGAPCTINGTLSITGTAGNRRVWFRGETYGIAQTLTINSAPSLTDADFRDIYVIGTAAPISGTRIGDLRGCRGITFDAPKTVYWVTAGGGNWSGNNWAATSGGAASTDNFPLAQDTATFVNTGLNTSATVTLDTAITYMGTVDMLGRTNAMTLNIAANFDIYGDWKNGSGTTLSSTQTLTFFGRNTQTITSSGKAFLGNMTVNTYGGTVQLADALNIGTNTLNVINGTFNTQNYNVTAGSLSSSNSNVRAINLGSSTVTLASGNTVTFTTSTNLTFNAGTSTIAVSAQAATFNGGGLNFYNVSFNATTANINTINGVNTFNNLTITAPASAGLMQFAFSANQTITGTLTCAGATAVRRIFLRSSTLGTQRDLTVGTLVADDCDFRDIDILGTAAGTSPTRAGDCGGNAGITFPSPKTVYWNLAGTQSWSSTGWASSSGGTPDINNFPLAQDTAVFDDTGSVTGAITVNAAWNIGTFDASNRTSAMVLTTAGNSPVVYGNWKFGTGVSSVDTTGSFIFGGRGVQTITSNGISFGCAINIFGFNNTVTLADAFSTTSATANRSTLTLTQGGFDAVSYNVTAQQVIISGPASPSIFKMGSGTWTLSGTSGVWNAATITNLTFYKGTANIVLSDTSTAARSFAGGGLSYNKLTIGGTTGTSTLTITGNNQFTELASTKTVAHTIAFGSNNQTFGAWTVTGTAGNVVTLTGTATGNTLAGACTSGIDYLAMGSIGFTNTSTGEFYAGANSTGTAAAPVYRTAKPADSTRYWVGGTGNWSDTARWSTSSGGAGGASVPRSHDDVVFDSASNATAYTATVNLINGGIRMKSLTISAPASGNVTLSGSEPIVGIHGDVTLPATGLTRTYTGAITLSGSTTGKTITTNGVAFSSPFAINGVGCEWTLGSALNIGFGNLTVTNGSFNTVNYNFNAGQLVSDNTNSRTITFGSNTITLIGGFNFGTTLSVAENLTFNAGTSQINIGGDPSTLTGNSKTFYNVSFNSQAATRTITGANTFNNLSVVGLTSAGITNLSFTADQTINGTLTLSAGTNATMRTFVRSDTIGTTRTLTCSAFSATDADFRDITIAGAAAPVSGTRLGDCKGNSGITFDAGVSKYWVLPSNGNFGIVTWSTTPTLTFTASCSGTTLTTTGSPALTVGMTVYTSTPASLGTITGGSGNTWTVSIGGTAASQKMYAGNIGTLPLAQDTAVFQADTLNSGNTVTINASYNIGTIDMSARTSNTMTLATGTTTPYIYGNWISGTGVTMSGAGGRITFAGRGTQTITSAGVAFTQPLGVDAVSGSVALNDALNVSYSSAGAFILYSGTFNAATYNVTLAGSFSAASTTTSRTWAVGSGTWTITGSGTVVSSSAVSLTVTGTGTISLTSASAKAFAGAGLSYSGITLNQGGAGTLTITGNNTFKDITNSYSAIGATTIAMGTTTQRVEQWTATGTSGKVLTVTGTNASTPATLILTGGTDPNVDYLAITGVRAYSLTDTWYAGANSTNNGSLGWYFEAAGGGAIDVSVIETASGSDVVQVVASIFNPSVSESATGADSISSRVIFQGDINESGTASDVIQAFRAYLSQILESASGSDTISAFQGFSSAFSDTVSGTDSVSAKYTAQASVSETASLADVVNGGLSFLGQISESASAADVLVATKAFFGAITEGASIADAVAVAASTFNATAADTAAGTDSVSTRATFISSTTDTATGTDTVAPRYITNPVISESGTGADTFAASQSFSTQILEAGTGADTVTVAPSVFNAPVVEISTIADTVAPPGSIYNAPVVETVVVSDAVIGAFLWNLIADNQTPGWQNINNSQPTTWSLEQTDQSPGWNGIKTL